MFKLFKYIMELQRQNILYKRAIADLFLIVKRKNPIMPPQYDLDDDCLHFLFQSVKELLEEKEQYP